MYNDTAVRFKTHDNEKQREVARYWCDNISTDIVYGGSKGSGKSYLGCSLIFGDALTYDGTNYFIAREALNDIRKYTIPSIYEVFGHWDLEPDEFFKFDGRDNIFRLKNGSNVFLLEASYQPRDPDFYRFGSMQMTRGWIEEAGQIMEAAKNNLAASIGRWKNDVYGITGKLLQTCNPSKNYLYREYYKKHKEGVLEPWKKYVQALPEDNKRLPDGYLENLNRILTPNEKERLLFGNWEFDDDPTVLCDYDAICDLFNNEHVKPTGKKYISADLAMQGRDRFIAGPWDGLVLDLTKGLDQAKSTGKSIETDLKNLMIKLSIPRSQSIADSDGLGAYLESYLNGIKTFHGGSAPKDKEYKLLKDECAFKLAELVNNREIRIICSPEQREKIIEELEVLKRVTADDADTKKRVIPKEKMKELLSRSPDYLDMLIMRMYFIIFKSSIFGYT